jgi:SAM-dependent methyltransferase
MRKGYSLIKKEMSETRAQEKGATKSLDPADTEEMLAGGDSTAVQQEMLKILELAPAYHKWIYTIFKPYIGKSIIEIGCGTGNFTQYLLDEASVISIDRSGEFLDTLKEKFGHRHNLSIRKMDVFDEEFMELKSQSIDTIICVSLLEHMDDDREILRRFYEILVPGGRVALFVPALMALFGSLDNEVGHCRRYERHELLQKIKESHFEPLLLSYFNMLGIPGWFLNARILKKKVLPARQIALFDKLVPFLEKVERIIHPPLGTCLIAVIQKKEGAPSIGL